MAATTAGLGSVGPQLNPRPCVHRPPRSLSAAPQRHLTHPRDAPAPRDPMPGLASRRCRPARTRRRRNWSPEDCGCCSLALPERLRHPSAPDLWLVTRAPLRPAASPPWAHQPCFTRSPPAGLPSLASSPVLFRGPPPLLSFPVQPGDSPSLCSCCFLSLKHLRAHPVAQLTPIGPQKALLQGSLPNAEADDGPALG